MAYWALKKNGKVIDVLTDEAGQTPDISKMLLEGTIDEVAKLANFEEAKRVLQGKTASSETGGKLDNLVRSVVDKAEGFINDLCDNLDGVRKEAVKGVKGGKNDINDIATRAKAAGQTLLKEVRAIHEKALEKAKAAKKKK